MRRWSRCTISLTHSFVRGDDRGRGFIGHGVMLQNDVYPRAVNEDGSVQTEAHWQVAKTRVSGELGCSKQYYCRRHDGESALVGAGDRVTRDVPDYAIVAGVAGTGIGDVRDHSNQAGRHNSC